jgi:hypothetical protein
MSLTAKTEGPRDLAFLLNEIDHLSREVVTIRAGVGVLLPGTVLGEIGAGLGAAAAEAGALVGTGNGAITMADPAVGAGVKAGDYKVVCIEPATDGGTFAVEDPDGIIIGRAVVGTAFTGLVKFTIADGSTDFSAGSYFPITVTKADPTGVGTWKKSPLTGTDGAEAAKAVLAYGVDATSVDVQAVIIRRVAAVKKPLLVFDASVDDAAKIATKLGQLAAHNIIAR